MQPAIKSINILTLAATCVVLGGSVADSWLLYIAGSVEYLTATWFIAILGISILTLARRRAVATIFRQVNEAQRHEQEIQDEEQKLRTTSRLATLGEMAGSVAHEINNPLAIIAGKVRQSIKALDASPPQLDQARTHIDTINRTTERIVRIIRGLKALSRSGDEDPMAVFESATLIEDCIFICSERFRTNGVELKLEMSTPPPKIRGRDVQIAQILINLLNNAFDAVQNQAEKLVVLSVTESTALVTIRVRDSGAPIPAAVRAKIMQPYFTTKGKGKGTGLGLSIAKGIAANHGGRLFLAPESVPTIFVLELPNPSHAAAEVQCA